MWHDVRQALRTFAQHRAFTATAVSVLALGIALNSATFSVVHALLYAPLPVHAPHELVSVYQVFPRQPDRPAVLIDDLRRFLGQHASDTFAGVTAFIGTHFTLRAEAQTDVVSGEVVAPSYFEVLQVRPVIGRALLASDDEVANPERAVVISHALWTRRFRSEPDVVGRQIELSPPWSQSPVVFTIIGVMPPSFKGISEPWRPTQIWVTMAQATGEPRMRYGVVAMARLGPDRSLEQAQAVVSAMGRQWYYQNPGATQEYEPRFVVYRTNDVRIPNNPAAAIVPARLAAAMTIVVAMVLLVAATNIAGILMARAVGRSGEIAVRRVLGAGTSRILRQLLVESLLLALLGGALAVPLVAWLIGLFRALTPLQFAFAVSLNTPVALVTLGICVATGLVVGLLPARQALSLDILPWLAASQAAQARPTRSRLRHAIMLPQVAVSLMLLLVAFVHVRALLKIELADVGYQPGNLLVANPRLRTKPGERPMGRDPARPDLEARYAERARFFYAQLFQRLQALPGDAEAAIASSLPLREAAERANWSALSEAAYANGGRVGIGTETTAVSPGYFRVMGMTVRAGRDFDDRDARSTARVAVVSRALAQRLWPGGDAIGRRFTVLSSWNPNDKLEWYETVGVVGDVSPILHERSPRPFAYLALGQEWRPTVAQVLARSDDDSRLLAPAVEAAVTGADPLADVYRVTTMSQMVAEMLYPRRIAAAVLAGSGAIAMFLATLGVYGVVSYSLAQRTGEIGVRMALGADRGDIIRLMLREGWIVALAGSIAGVAAGWAAIRLTSSRFLAMPDVDLTALVIAPLAISAVVLLACYIPARRAARLDAMAVLRRL
jgi:putative ABC transport system permease protein